MTATGFEAVKKRPGGFETRPYEGHSDRRSGAVGGNAVATLLLMLCTATVGVAAPPQEPILAETLPNGVRLAIQERAGSGTFALQLTVLGGAAEDPAEHFGLSPLLARMLLRGTPSIAASEQARRVEATGSSLEARANATGIALTAVGPGAALAEVFDIAADALLHARLDANDLAKEIGLARQSLANARDDPSEALWRTALPLVYGSHPLGRTVEDPSSYAAALEIEALRRAREQRFVGRRLLVVLVGGIDAPSARAQAAAAFGSMPAGDPAPPLAAPEPLPAERRARARRRTSQPELLIAFPTAGTADADAPAQDVLNQILAGFQERLSAEIRERRGWAYWVGAWDARYPGAGAFGIVTAVPKQHLAATETLIRAELRRIATEAPSAEEVERARRFLLTARARAWQRSAERARHFTSDLVQGQAARDYDELAARYAQVTPEAVRDLARRMFETSEPVIVTLH